MPKSQDPSQIVEGHVIAGQYTLQVWLSAASGMAATARQKSYKG